MKADRSLVPLDGSTMAEAAIGEAATIGPANSVLVLMRAASAWALPGADVIEAQVSSVREAEEYLTGLKEKLERDGALAVETHVWYGPAAAAIVEAARVTKADLIVMTTHGRSGIGRVVWGSVAESVLRSTSAPILLVRSPGAPVETPRDASDARPAGRTASAPRLEGVR